MTSLNAYLRKFHEWSKGIAETAKVYLDKLEITGFSGSEPYLTEKIQKYVQMISEDTELVRIYSDSAQPKSQLENAVRIFALVEERFLALKEIYQIFKSFRIDITKQGTFTSSGTSLSFSYLQDLNATLDDITRSVEGLELEMSKDMVGELLLTSLSDFSLKQVKDITEIYRQYLEKEKAHLIIQFYTRVLQHAIRENTGTAEGKEVIRYITKTVEELKTQILEVSELQEIDVTNRQHNAIQYMLQKFNLIPDGPSRPLEDICRDIFQCTLPKNSKDLFLTLTRDLNAKKENRQHFGLVVIHKVSARPYEHNLWTLIDEAYIEKNNLMQSPEYGINEISIRRTKTLSPLGDAGEAGDVSDTTGKKNKKKTEQITLPTTKGGSSYVYVNIEYFGEDNNFFYVLESLDGETYHMLVPWHLGENGIYSMPAAWLEGLSSVKQCPSRRLQSYNCILNEEIMFHAHPPLIKMEQLSQEEIRKEEGQWRTLRGEIKKQTMGALQKIVGNYFENSDSLTWGKIDTFIRKQIPVICAVLIEAIVENIALETGSIPTGLHPVVARQILAEIQFAYARDLDKLQRSIGRDMEEFYLKDYQSALNRSVGSQISVSQLASTKNKVIDTIASVLEDLLEKYVNRKSNIYISITGKLELLEKSLTKIII